jgi:hypothetical protein
LELSDPDPSGRQLELLKHRLSGDAFYWIDFCCLPQKPRTVSDEQAFRQSLGLLPSMMFDTSFMILRLDGDGYFRRAWCFFETLAANVLGKEISYALESPTMAALVEGEERDAMESALLQGSIPSGLEVTDPLDLAAISDAAETVGTFLRLRSLEHYMALGQTVSSGNLFFGEDPYYFLATCNLSELIRWSFQQARRHGLRLVELSRDYSEENFFERLAGIDHFRHTVNPYALPKKVVLDQSRLGWFIINKHAQTSAANLFYILTSMIH